MTDDTTEEDDTAHHSLKPPVDAWVEIRVNDSRMTRFGVDAGEEVTIHLEQRTDDTDDEA